MGGAVKRGVEIGASTCVGNGAEKVAVGNDVDDALSPEAESWDGIWEAIGNGADVGVWADEL